MDLGTIILTGKTLVFGHKSLGISVKVEIKLNSWVKLYCFRVNQPQVVGPGAPTPLSTLRRVAAIRLWLIVCG